MLNGLLLGLASTAQYSDLLRRLSSRLSLSLWYYRGWIT